MNWLKTKFSTCFLQRERKYITPRRARRKFINVLKGRRNVNRFKKRKRSRNAPKPSAPIMFISPVPSAPPAHLF